MQWNISSQDEKKSSNNREIIICEKILFVYVKIKWHIFFISASAQDKQ